MHKRSIITILLTILVFSAAVVLGVSSVYRVNAVTLEVSVISEVAEEEADSLQKKLLSRYQSESIFFVDEQAAEEEFAAFPYFRMVSFRKQYPNRLVIEATEDAEMFAVEKGDGNYYILGPDGTILGVRGDTANRSDGAENILVTGLSATGNRGEILTGDECIRPLIDFCAEADSRLNGLRSNLVSVEVMKPTSSSADISFCLVLREGVKAYVRNPLNLT
ncbi:MAG TPA: FtsQ-type POTRA domain-containing protein, partial [Candidatus Scatosoma pullistercoris]|nr:FtsQ-type POTRA domain-containing protein [Candidatus Scatosoma pullistercoris]